MYGEADNVNIFKRGNISISIMLSDWSTYLYVMVRCRFLPIVIPLAPNVCMIYATTEGSRSVDCKSFLWCFVTHSLKFPPLFPVLFPNHTCII